jgi:hypothetical protein
MSLTSACLIIDAFGGIEHDDPQARFSVTRSDGADALRVVHRLTTIFSVECLAVDNNVNWNGARRDRLAF